MGLDDPASRGMGGAPVPRRKLNLLFPLAAILSFLFILTALVAANPISQELDGPFVRMMKANGMWVMSVEVIAIMGSGISAMWLESRFTKESEKPTISKSHSESEPE